MVATARATIDPGEVSSMARTIRVLGIDAANWVFHSVGRAVWRAIRLLTFAAWARSD
jgi:hypothetical protein